MEKIRPDDLTIKEWYKRMLRAKEYYRNSHRRCLVHTGRECSQLVPSTEEIHRLVQLIEEEIAVRLGHRPAYFAYNIPPGADWVRTAQKIVDTWKYYLDHKGEYTSIVDLMPYMAD